MLHSWSLLGRSISDTGAGALYSRILVLIRRTLCRPRIVFSERPGEGRALLCRIISPYTSFNYARAKLSKWRRALSPGEFELDTEWCQVRLYHAWNEEMSDIADFSCGCATLSGFAEIKFRSRSNISTESLEPKWSSRHPSLTEFTAPNRRMNILARNRRVKLMYCAVAGRNPL